MCGPQNIIIEWICRPEFMNAGSCLDLLKCGALPLITSKNRFAFFLISLSCPLFLVICRFGARKFVICGLREWRISDDWFDAIHITLVRSQPTP